MLNMIVTRLDGKTYDLGDIGITLREFRPESPSPRTITEQVEGLHGAVDTGTTYDVRRINCSFYLKAVDKHDFYLLRDEVFALFDSLHPFYITETYNPGKRWLVKVNEPYSIDQQRIYGFFDIVFVAFQPFAESIGTTGTPKTFSEDVWQFGNGLVAEDYTYTHNTNSFRIFNGGNVAVSPLQMPLRIVFKGPSKGLTISNATTKTVWSYDGSSSTGDRIVIDRVTSTKNEVSIFGSTNRKFITLSPGFNDIQVSGNTGGFEITFDFRFYYM